MKKWIYIIIGGLLLMNVSAYDYQTLINESENLFDYYNFSLTSSTDNNTINFTFYDNSTGVLIIEDDIFNLIDYNSSIYFNSSSTVNVNISINISDIGDDNLSYVLVLNSTNSNVTINKSFFIEVNPYVPPEPEWHSLDVGEYQLSICSNFLPYNFSKDITIGGNNGNVINLSATKDWFSIPDNITITSDEYVTVSIPGTLPIDLNIDTYTEYIYFTFNNSNQESIKFIFDIIDCGLLMDWEDYISDCDSYIIGSEEYHFCRMDAQNKYYNDLMLEYTRRNRTEYINITQNVTKEIPIEVYRWNNKTVEQLVSDAVIRAMEDTLNKRLNEKDEELIIKNDEIQELRTRTNEYDKTMASIPNEVNKTANNIIQKFLDRESRRRGWFWGISILCIFIGLGIGGYYWWKTNNLY